MSNEKPTSAQLTNARSNNMELKSILKNLIKERDITTISLTISTKVADYFSSLKVADKDRR